MTLEEKIIGMLDEQKISYEIVEHELVYTNPAMAEALKVDESDIFRPGISQKRFCLFQPRRPR